MLQFYKLEDAARMLGISPDELKRMAQRNEIRYFSDRGNMQFRAQEIEELARRRGRGSDPELQATDKPSSGRLRKQGDAPRGEEAFDFQVSSDDESVQIGQELSSEGGSSKKGSKSGKQAKSPPPKPGSDSDVRLVADGSDLDFQVADDAKTSKPDSGVRILPLEIQSDSDVKIVPEGPEDSNIVLKGGQKKSGSDSDIRLHPEKAGQSGSSLRSKAKGPSDAEFVTEEIDLDAEELQLREAESSKRMGKGPKTMKPGKGDTAEQSPFELSDPKMPKQKPKSDKKKKTTDSSSDFELTPASAQGDLSPLDTGSSEEEVSLGELSGAAGGSGINLQDPADSGISLEQSSGEEALDFELSDEVTATPKPGPGGGDSDSEFELSMDSGKAGPHKTPKPTKPDKSDSDSEFELTLDDSGDLLPLDEKAPAPAAAEGEEDIFETDFEVPALDDDSGSEAVALDESDTDLESSDFDLALDEQDASGEGESGSEVVALEDEEEAEAGASTVARPRKKSTKVAKGDEELVDEDDEAVVAPTRAVVAKPAEWGLLPALVLIPSVLVMFFVTIIGFEMVKSMWGYRQGSTVASPVASWLANTVFDQKVP
jgi:hypothetical protein